MRQLYLIMVSALFLTNPLSASDTSDERLEKRKEMDAKCEAAREVLLEPMREELFVECIENGGDEEYCERTSSTYNGRIGNNTLMFYDIPECVAAFEYRRSYRSD